MDFEALTSKPYNRQEGFTFVEVVISCMIMMLLVAAVIHYHSSAGAPKNQAYYLKAVQVAKAELEKLRALSEFDTVSSFAEFTANGSAPNNKPPHAASPPNLATASLAASFAFAFSIALDS